MQNSHKYVVNVFGLSSTDVRVISPFVGGAFGSGLRPQYQLFLAVMAALELKRSVRVVLTRDQMFTFGYRPDTIQTVALGANPDGVLQAIIHEAVAGTSHFEDFHENVVGWSACSITAIMSGWPTSLPRSIPPHRPTCARLADNRGVRARDRHGRACLRDRRRSGRAALAELCREDENEDKPHSSRAARMLSARCRAVRLVQAQSSAPLDA